MTKLTQSVFAGLLASGAIVVASTSAQAASLKSFDAQNVATPACVGKQTCLVNNFFTLSAFSNTGGTLKADQQIFVKTFGNDQTKGIGVVKNILDIKTTNGKPNGKVNDPSEGEIDLNELLRVGFKTEGILKSLQLSFLYQPGVNQDQVFEAAVVTADGVLNQGILTVTGNKTATWSFGNVIVANAVTNVSKSDNKGGGSYSITNPFGNIKIAGFSLTPKQQQAANGTTPTSFKNSDFTLSAATVAVPEPTMLVGLGAVGALLAASRRRKAVQG